MCFFLVTALHLIILFFSGHVLTAPTDDCPPIPCTEHGRGPIIQFPFRHESQHPQHCGYNSSFVLSCSPDKTQTLIELPFTGTLVVETINYDTQTLLVSDPDGCILQKIHHLNVSGFTLSRWLDYSGYRTRDYVLLNCPAGGHGFSDLFTCYRGSDYRLLAVESYDSLDSNDYFVFCTKVHEFLSVSWRLNIITNDMTLEWSEPDCRQCVENERGCRLKNTSIGGDNRVECFDRPVVKKKGASKGPLIAEAAIGSCAFVIIVGVALMLYRSFKIEMRHQRTIEIFLQDYKALKPTRFSYMDLKKITNQFSEKLGEGGYGVVFKGRISKEIIVAVKVLNNSQGNGDEFVNEIGTIGRVHHVNVVRLVGFCAEGYRRALVYEFLPNESLEKFIFQEGDDEGRRNSLGWKGLYDIALGIAKGIEYLHQGCDQQILHFDIKPHNILLDHDFNPKISDFGLAKWCSKEQSAVTMTAARGTVGYIAPEVLSRTFGKVSYKSDIYSYGMLLLELVGGRKNVDHGANASQVYFPQWIYNHVNLGEDFWAQLEEGEDGKLAKKITMVGLWCIQWHPVDRPSMKEVVQMLEGDMDDLATPPNPFPTMDVANSTREEIIAKLNYQPKLASILEIEE